MSELGAETMKMYYKTGTELVTRTLLWVMATDSLLSLGRHFPEHRLRWNWAALVVAITLFALTYVADDRVRVKTSALITFICYTLNTYFLW